MPALRLLTTAAFTLLALSCSASNNKNRIEGKWKFGSDNPQRRNGAVVFNDDGSVKLIGTGANPDPIVWRYKLLAADEVDFYGLPPQLDLFPSTSGVARVTIQITDVPEGQYEGRAMTLTDSEGRTLKLVQVEDR